MKKIKKLLYLLQLEDYQAGRYLSWLKKFSINDLEEQKNKLKLTTRAKIILAISLFLSLFIGKERGIALANNFINPFFRFLEEVVVLTAKIKLHFYPKLIKFIITGSYGKTTFKEMLSWVLQSQYAVLKTPQNINTRLGIAKTIVKQLNRNHQVFVGEAGAYRRGEIKAICQMVQPTFGIVTVIGFMHLERFKTLEEIRRTKLELISFIKDKNKLFMPFKDHKFLNFKEVINKIGESLDIPKTVIKNRLSQFEQIEHRLTTKKLGSNLILLDDTYNSNPLGFKKALTELKKYKNYQKIVVTPGMIELGSMQDKLNKAMAKEIAAIADILVIVGQTNRKALSIKDKLLKIIYLNKNENLDAKITAFLKLPTVILLENELPDHYF